MAQDNKLMTTATPKPATAAMDIPADRVTRIAAETDEGGARKAPCPVLRNRFQEKAQPVKLILGDEVLRALPKVFKLQPKMTAPSYGWHYNGKIVIEVDGVQVPVQANLLFTCVGSNLNTK